MTDLEIEDTPMHIIPGREVDPFLRQTGPEIPSPGSAVAKALVLAVDLLEEGLPQEEEVIDWGSVQEDIEL